MRADEYLKAVGSVIRDVRSAQALSQEELAEKARMSRNMLSAVETGVYNPSLRKLFDLTRALKLTPAALLTKAENRLP